MTHNGKLYGFVTSKNGVSYYRCMTNPRDEVKVIGGEVIGCKIRDEVK